MFKIPLCTQHSNVVCRQISTIFLGHSWHDVI
uniref:Uncharacterized protein n=1 Tax=Arundo donax TaxID=35708 RepID=A0A0A9HDV7_ARUDO